jgi:hypothetical protein
VDDRLFQLAQVNVALLREPLDSPLVADFVAALDPINALADISPGFIWRLQTEEGDATSIRAFDDDLIIVNMSVWESIESLADYVYRSAHTTVLRRRREWFQHMKEAYSALWWIPTGVLPTVTEAVGRLEHLRRHGPSAHAFTFKRPFSPGDVAVEPPRGAAWLCPA